jgi:hypothetical protein
MRAFGEKQAADGDVMQALLSETGLALLKRNASGNTVIDCTALGVMPL